MLKLVLGWWWRKKKFAHRPAGSAPTFVSAEIGTLDDSTVVVTFSAPVAYSDLAAGVVVKVNTVTRSILSATRQANGALVRYVLSAPVVFGDTVTWAYTAASGYIVSAWGSVALANVSAQAVTNNVPSTGATLPAVASATLLLNLQANALALNDGDPVALWADASGLGHDFTQSGAARPTYHANDGGYPSVDLTTGAEKWLLGPDITGGIASLAMVLVSAYDGVGGNAFGLTKINHNGNDAGWYIYTGGTNWTIQDQGDNNQADTYGAGAGGTGFKIWTYEMASAAVNLKLYYNGAVDSAGNNPPNFDFSNSQPLRLGLTGSAIGVAATSGMKYRAVMIYQITSLAAWQATDRAAIETWVGNLYGLTVP